MNLPHALAAAVLVLLTQSTFADTPLRAFYEKGTWHLNATSWIGDGTRSELTDEGLLIADESTQTGSGRCYLLNWEADPAKGAALEARVKVVSCSAPWGVSMMAADGVHEEGLTLFPDRLLLPHSGLSAPFNTTDGFHTYRLEVKGKDVRAYVDGRLLIDGVGKYTTSANAGRNQCSFGAAASPATGTAIWQWVRYQSEKPEGALPAKPEVPAIEGLEVKVGETVDIIPGPTYRSLFQFRDGKIAVADRRSEDGGKTWTKAPYSLNTNAFEFEDGEIIAPGFNTTKAGDGVFEVPLSRSTDGGKTFQRETARLNIPLGTGGTGDDGKYYPGPGVDHAIVQLRDGSLLMAMYGYFTTDTVLCPAFKPEWKVYKYRTWVMRSTDRGRTWDLRSTVAYDPSVGAESFCEADLLQLPGGDLLCFMRTGGEPPKYVTPLYCSRSQDDGLTWSKPEPIADRGVWPNACRLRSGVLAVTYGRPDNWLAFSLDEGKTWTGHFCFYRGATTSYNTVAEVAPNTLLVVYDRRRLAPDGNLQSGIAGTFFTVTRR